MQSNRTYPLILARLLLLSALLVSGCAQAAAPTAPVIPTDAQPAAAPSATPQPPTAVPTVAPTTAPTAAPTATTAPTATATTEPTATPAPTLGPAMQDSLSAWCIQEGVALSYISDPLKPLDNVRTGTIVNGALEVRNLPAGACVFIYSFNQPAPQGLKLQVFDSLNKEPWLTADLTPVQGQPQSAAVTLTHSYIVAPPAWEIHYQFALLDANGTELRRDPVNLHRWEPAICWNGQKPNVFTLRCPLQQDLHPWDPSYRTPFPTAVPEDD